jgi:dTDP-4-dehydrorhamnose reductase
MQTEDAASTRGTPATAGQVAFENERRWLSLDLLTGRVDATHPLRSYLRQAGVVDHDLEWFRATAFDPLLIGLNYYVTSDRFLDDQVSRYSPTVVGGNGCLRYADVAVAHVSGLHMRGHQAVLCEAWQRYTRPVAITEAHLGSTREAQMRWLVEAWRAAHRAKAAGADVRAVTAWALLGSWDWDSLVTCGRDHYEPGAFDVRGNRPRTTGVATVIRDLANGWEPAHPILVAAGEDSNRHGGAQRSPPILIVGAAGTLGSAFTRACERRRIAHVALSHQDLDIAQLASVREALAAYQPWAVINAAGYVRVDEGEGDRRLCHLVNAVGPAVLAFACRQSGVKLMTFSSDQVFDGQGRRPYVESDPVSPLNIYGFTKVEAERRVLALDAGALVVRTSSFYGPWDGANFVTRTLDALASGRPVTLAGTEIMSPTYVPDLVDAALDLLIDGACGVWHLANAGEVTWDQLVRRAAMMAGLNVDAIHAIQPALAIAARPVYSALGTERGTCLPPWEQSLERYVRERVVVVTAA